MPKKANAKWKGKIGIRERKTEKERRREDPRPFCRLESDEEGGEESYVEDALYDPNPPPPLSSIYLRAMKMAAKKAMLEPTRKMTFRTKMPFATPALTQLHPHPPPPFYQYT